MTKVLDTVLLLALPASGKSEVRRYLAHLNPEESVEQMHLGPTVQLDDFPYVHLMRRIDDELEALGEPRLYFVDPDKSYADPHHWGTLIHLLNEDYADLVAKKKHSRDDAGRHLMQRFDRASEAAGAETRLAKLDDSVQTKIAAAMNKEAAEHLDELEKNYPDTLEGKTLVIEFARGGKQGSSLPLDKPYGYRHSLSCLSEELLSKAKVLYVWVTPEESRRKNDARTDPNDPGSILHHGVPMYVMLNEYGLDDMEWLEQNSEKPGTITIEKNGKKFHLPLARVDNRKDLTTFVREDQKDWAKEDVDALHSALAGGLNHLANFKG